MTDNPNPSRDELTSRTAMAIYTGWVAEHGFPNGLRTWNELPAETEGRLAADLHCKQTWLGIAEFAVVALKGVGDGWRADMENAPRDGRQVDLIINGAFRLPDCKWGKEEPHREETWLNYRPHPDALHDFEWQEIDAKDVTHWMLRPLPPAPSTEGEG